MLIINQHVAMHHSLFPWHRILDVEDNDDNDEDDDDDDEDDDDDADDGDDDDNCINAIDDEYQPTCCDAPQFVSLAPNTGGIYNLHSNGIETDEDNDDYDEDCDDDEDDDEDDDDDVQDGLTRCPEPSDEGDICGDTG